MLHTSVVEYGEDGDPVDTVGKTLADISAYSLYLAGLPHLFYLRGGPKNLNSWFPRGLSFVAYLTSFIVNSAVSPWNIFLFVLTPAVSPRIIFLCVSSVVHSNFRGFLADNPSLRS